MGKKVDLNARRNNNNHIKSNRNFYPNYNLSEDTIDQENETNNSQIRQSVSKSKREYDLPKSANLTIKMPIKVKMIITIFIIGAIFIFLMLYVTLFGNEESLSGKYTLGQTCTTVTITDTENYIYDGDVSFNEYIEGVVSAESNNSTDLEYLKLLSIIARTYFFENADSSCTVEGNSEFQNYQDVDDHINRDLIKLANNETKDLVVVYKEELVSTDYFPGCVVNSDRQYYYLRYNETNLQKIPKEWANQIGLNQELQDLYSQVDKTNSDIDSRMCPKNNDEYGMSKIGALYLITKENYTYEKVIKYYFGNDVEIIKNEFINASNGDFINPTNYISCTSPYGNRIDPYSKEEGFHSGIDITTTGGEDIYAVKSGKITRVVNTVTEINSQSPSSSNGNGYGNNVIIDHGDGITTLYAHMKYGSIPDWVVVGATVNQGDQIGQVGSTGRSTGNHLHYEVRIGGSTVDPADYLDLTNATGECKR